MTKIIHSPLQRAKRTAQAVADRLELSMEEDDRLIEMDFGKYDGVPSKDAAFRKHVRSLLYVSQMVNPC